MKKTYQNKKSKIQNILNPKSAIKKNPKAANFKKIKIIKIFSIVLKLKIIFSTYFVIN